MGFELKVECLFFRVEDGVTLLPSALGKLLNRFVCALCGLLRRRWFDCSVLLFGGFVALGSVSPYPRYYNQLLLDTDDFVDPPPMQRLTFSYGLQAALDRRLPSKATPGDELRCLARNIYFEARSEAVEGMRAVGHVVMNRVASERFPDTVCEVVHQGGTRRHRCQFSWWCDGRKEVIAEGHAWEDSREIATLVFWGLSPDITGGALWYHADYVKPSWRKAFEEGPTIGHHVFYSPLEAAAKAARDQNAASFLRHP